MVDKSTFKWTIARPTIDWVMLWSDHYKLEQSLQETNTSSQRSGTKVCSILSDVGIQLCHV